MTWQEAAGGPGSTSSGLFDGGFSWGMAVLAILGFFAVVAVCGFGVVARLRDRASDRRSLEAFRRSTQLAGVGPVPPADPAHPVTSAESSKSTESSRRAGVTPAD
jgi:hypothetical protein